MQGPDVKKPIDFQLVLTSNSQSFQDFPLGVTGIPVGSHPGAFSVRRKNHVHEGVDLYCPEGTDVYPMESGVVVGTFDFTGVMAGSPWWHDTQCVMVEGKSGVILYGEIFAAQLFPQGYYVTPSDLLGTVKRVLKVDKGRPMSMLHIELHKPGTQFFSPWEGDRPDSILDPTPLLSQFAINGRLI